MLLRGYSARNLSPLRHRFPTAVKLMLLSLYSQDQTNQDSKLAKRGKTPHNQLFAVRLFSQNPFSSYPSHELEWLRVVAQ